MVRGYARTVKQHARQRIPSLLTECVGTLRRLKLGGIIASIAVEKREEKPAPHAPVL